ncbi:MAG TPA: ATP-binding protein, partial [Polyangiaceae bacterium]|nr:ATP-binding protein [Polyangiaceae bacterium]
KYWGKYSDGDKAYCLGLAARIVNVINADSFSPVFRPSGVPLIERLQTFLATGDERLLRITLAGVSYEYRAREVMANVIGRALLSLARSGSLSGAPLIVVVDEAHNFLGRDIGSEDSAVRLDAFELIAREGRKYGLNLCLATQRPRDLTEGVLSQMGTLIVHRLTNDRDRDVVERACGEIDRSASAFLPNLKPGEAAVIGVDFPIPMTIQVEPPKVRPVSDGPNYQRSWRV